MTTELTVLAWGCVLALVHVFAAIRAKTRQYGTKWNMSARDEEVPPLNPVAGRLARAQANFYESFPIMVGGDPDRQRRPSRKPLDRARRADLARRAPPLPAALRLRRPGPALARLDRGPRRHRHGALAGAGGGVLGEQSPIRGQSLIRALIYHIR